MWGHFWLLQSRPHRLAYLSQSLRVRHLSWIWCFSRTAHFCLLVGPALQSSLHSGSVLKHTKVFCTTFLFNAVTCVTKYVHGLTSHYSEKAYFVCDLVTEGEVCLSPIQSAARWIAGEESRIAPLCSFRFADRRRGGRWWRGWRTGRGRGGVCLKARYRWPMDKTRWLRDTYQFHSLA